MILVGTVGAFFTYGITLLFYCCLIIYIPALFWGIFELVIAIRLLLGKKLKKPPLYISIVDIVIGAFLILNIYFILFGIILVTLGIINIVNMKNTEVQEYFGKEDIEDEYAEYLKDD